MPVEGLYIRGFIYRGLRLILFFKGPGDELLMRFQLSFGTYLLKIVMRFHPGIGTLEKLHRYDFSVFIDIGIFLDAKVFI